MFPYITLFGRDIGLYSIMVLCGIFASGIYASLFANKTGHDYTEVIIFMLIISTGAIIGSHALYALVNYKNIIYVYENIMRINTFQKLFNVLNYILGGSVFYGGLIGSITTGFILIKKNSKYNMFIDIVATSIPLFHFFGRIGCFLGGCCYGIESNVGFIYKNNPIIEANNAKRFPVQLLEALFNILLFFLLLYFLKNKKFKNKLLFVYLGIYSIGRFFLEFLRGDDHRGIWHGLSTSQMISILILLFTIAFFYNYWKKPSKHP